MRNDATISAQLGKRNSLHKRDAASAPIVEMLGRKPKVGANQITTNLVNQHAIGERGLGHGARINGAFMIGKQFSLIELHDAHLFSVDMIDVGLRIRRRIEEMGITQVELARATGLSAQRLSNYIQGNRPPDIESLAKIAKALRVPADTLLGLSDSAPTDIRAVILRLLELDGMPLPRAEAIADAAARALQLLSALPNEGESRTRALLAAQAAWQMRLPSEPS